MPAQRTHDIAVDDVESDGSTYLTIKIPGSCSSSRASSRTLASPYTVLPQEERKLKLKQLTDQVYVAGEPIDIYGVMLNPTAVFDTFWRFAAERKAIDDRRRAGESRP
jgi:hypothetical protein